MRYGRCAALLGAATLALCVAASARAADLVIAMPHLVSGHAMANVLKVAIEEFIKRFPRFELAGDVRWSVGQIRGPRELPVRILQVAD